MFIIFNPASPSVQAINSFVSSSINLKHPDKKKRDKTMKIRLLKIYNFKMKLLIFINEVKRQ